MGLEDMRGFIIALGIGLVVISLARSLVEGLKSAPNNRKAAGGCVVAVFGAFIILAGILG